MGLIAHAPSTPFAHKPLLPFRLRTLGKHHAQEALERVVNELPIKLAVRPTDQCVYMCWFGCDVAQPPISAIADVACALDENLLQVVVECYLRTCRVSIVLCSHLGVRQKDSVALTHISLGMIGSPRAIGMEGQQVDRHGGSMTQESAGCHRAAITSNCDLARIWAIAAR